MNKYLLETFAKKSTFFSWKNYSWTTMRKMFVNQSMKNFLEYLVTINFELNSILVHKRFLTWNSKMGFYERLSFRKCLFGKLLPFVRHKHCSLFVYSLPGKVSDLLALSWKKVLSPEILECIQTMVHRNTHKNNL